MSQDDRESALGKMASFLGGGFKKVAEAKKKRKKEIEAAAKAAGVKALK